jgi:hypothetical protein
MRIVAVIGETINFQREQGIGTPEQKKLMFKNMRLK